MPMVGQCGISTLRITGDLTFTQTHISIGLSRIQREGQCVAEIRNHWMVIFRGIEGRWLTNGSDSIFACGMTPG